MGKTRRITFRMKHLISALISGARISPDEAQAIATIVLEHIKKRINKDKGVLIPGFGRFKKFQRHKTLPWDRTKLVKKATVSFSASWVFVRDYLRDVSTKHPQGGKIAYEYNKKYLQRKRIERIKKGIGTPAELARDRRRYQMYLDKQKKNKDNENS